MASNSCSPCGAPVLLRLALGVVFIWAGAIKVATMMPVKGEDAATLANMGVVTPNVVKATAPATPPAPKPSGSSGAPNPTPPAEAPKTQSARPVPVEPLASLSGTPALMNVIPARAGGKTYTAEDFPEDVQVRMVNGLALSLKKAASPFDAEGRPVKPIWPDFLAKDKWPVYMAWACALTELAGGAFVLLGFLTRFWAFGLAVVMGTAMWLTVFGPAISSGNTQYGILPNHAWNDFSTWENHMSWQGFQMQVVMFLVALAVVGIGPGRMAVDRILFPPAAPPAKPKPENAPAAH